MRWPEYEGKAKIPEGHYQFRLNREPDLKVFKYTDRNGIEKTGHQIIIYATGLNAAGTFTVADRITVWEPRYRDLLDALKVEHGKDIEMVGGVFEADIVHDADKTDPMKSWPRIVNIVVNNDLPPTNDGGGDDIPF
jgi:hypothetical protein